MVEAETRGQSFQKAKGVQRKDCPPVKAKKVSA
jgi:hypothetical protein